LKKESAFKPKAYNTHLFSFLFNSFNLASFSF